MAESDLRVHGLIVQAGPCALSFLASLCVMSVEVAAGRMMAPFVGAGLYTWTSVIGVVLAGITVGNLVGGRLADRFDPRRALSILCVAAALATLAVPTANHWVARWINWEQSTQASFPLRIFLHATGVFLLPSACLGLVGPVVAKYALSHGLSTGRTVGNVYAWGALGSIAGTFATGFFLIDAIGSDPIALWVSVLLGLAGVALAPRAVLSLLVVAWPLPVGLVAAFFLVSGRGPAEYVVSGGQLLLRERGTYCWLYADESQYSFIRVAENRQLRTRNLFLDFLRHSSYAPSDEGALRDDYEKLYASLTARIAGGRDDLRTLFLGGGGYVLPRYLRARWPASTIQVAEIDPAVTLANLRAFGLRQEDIRIVVGPAVPGISAASGVPGSPETPATRGGGDSGSGDRKPIEVYHLDAHNHLEDLIRLKRSGRGFEPFDFVYGDAFNDFCVPFHLVTLEFAEKIQEILRPETGVYLMNLIEIYESGRFLGAEYLTLRRVFPHIYVYGNFQSFASRRWRMRNTYIVAASLRPLDLEQLGTRPGEQRFTGVLLGADEMQHLERCAAGVILTDDYSPVENLLDEVVRRRTQ